MRETTEDEALVLNSHELGESDLLLTLYCRRIGRIPAIAKGARRSKKRFVNKLEIFSYLNIDITIRESTALAFLHQAELHTSFSHLRTSYPAYLAASVIQELLLAGIREGEHDDNLFRLSLWSLHNLRQPERHRATITLFLLRYLDCLGYRPELERCGRCRQPVNPKTKYIFHSVDGALRCCRCEQFRTPGLGQGTIRMLQTAQNIPLERLGRLRLSAPTITEGLQPLYNCCRNILQRDINSWPVFLARQKL